MVTSMLIFWPYMITRIDEKNEGKTMTIRKIIQIDEELCNGCGQCITGCAEGALALVDGKAKIISDSYCDGLGACLQACPQRALTIIERESAPFDEALVAAKMRHAPKAPAQPRGCPGAAVRTFAPPETPCQPNAAPGRGPSHWPIKLMLAPASAPFLKEAHVLLAADCAAGASPLFRSRFAQGKTLLLACPKLGDSAAHTAHLTEILARNQLASLTILRMEVPCCRALSVSAHTAAERAGSNVEITEHVLTTAGAVAL